MYYLQKLLSKKAFDKSAATLATVEASLTFHCHSGCLPLASTLKLVRERHVIQNDMGGRECQKNGQEFSHVFCFADDRSTLDWRRV